MGWRVTTSDLPVLFCQLSAISFQFLSPDVDLVIDGRKVDG
jgi:hypothetical protein